MNRNKYLLLLITLITISYVIAYQPPYYQLSCELNMELIDSYNLYVSKEIVDITKEEYYSQRLENEKLCLSENCTVFIKKEPNWKRLILCKNNNQECLDELRISLNLSNEYLQINGYQFSGIDSAAYFLKDICKGNISSVCVDGDCNTLQKQKTNNIPISIIIFALVIILIITTITILFLKKRKNK